MGSSVASTASFCDDPSSIQYYRRQEDSLVSKELAEVSTVQDAELIKVGERLPTAGGLEVEGNLVAGLAQPQRTGKLLPLIGEIIEQGVNPYHALESYSQAAAAFPDRPEGHFRMGQALASLAQFDEARTAFLRALKINPHHRKCLTALAAVEQKVGNLTSALRTLERATAYHPADFRIARQLVEVLLASGRLPEARERLDALLIARPEDGTIQLLCGRVAEASGDFNAAIDSFRLAIKHTRDPSKAYIALARLLVRDDVEQAERILREAVHRTPTSVKLILALADVIGRQGNWASCLSVVEDALTYLPLEFDLAARKVSCLYRLHNWDMARKTIGSLAIEYSRDAAALRQLAGIAKNSADFESACRCYEAADALGQSSPEVAVAIGRLHIRLGRLDEAESAFLSGLRRQPESVGGLAGLAEVERRRKNWSRAASLACDALAMEPENNTLRLKLAEDLVRLGRWSEADTQLAPLLKYDCPIENVLYCAAHLAEIQGRRPDALHFFERAFHAYPQSLKAAENLCSALCRAGQHKDAEAILRQVICDRPNWTKGKLQLAQVLSDIGRFDDSTEIANSILIDDPAIADAWILLSKNAAKSASMEVSADFLARGRQISGPSIGMLLAQSGFYFSLGLDSAGDAILCEAEERYPTSARVLTYRLQRSIIHGRFSDVEAATSAGMLPKPEAARLIGQMEASKLRFPEAEIAYHEALLHHPYYRPALAGKMKSQLLQMKIVEAQQTMAQINYLDHGRIVARGQSTNISQGLLGEICNEFWIYYDSLKDVGASIAKPQISALLDMNREADGSTGAAMALAIGLRRANVFPGPMCNPCSAEICNNGSRRPIPHQIFQFWDSEYPPADVTSIMQSWTNENVGWTYNLFNLKTARAYLEDSAALDVRKAFRQANHAAQKADIFRLAVLLNEGGVYADVDDRCMGRLDDLVDGPEAVLRQEHLGSIGNNFIAIAPGHPLILEALQDATTAVLRGDSESIWLSTGPGMLTRAFARYLAANTSNLSTLTGPVRLLLDFELKPYLTSGCRANYKSSAKHWVIREFTTSR